MRIAAIEGGGTAWKVAIAEDQPDNLVERAEFETLPSPEETLTNVKAWLLERNFDCIGVASFGPIDARKGSPTYGFITSTPKPGWRNTNVLQLLGVYDDFKHLPHSFDTDVNAPALAEYILHRQPHTTSSAYVTIGTGIGVGLVINGETVKGLLHPEAGHISIRLADDESFRGSCPFHGSCVEGMCSTVALTARLNCKNEDLPNVSDDHMVWDRTAFYIAQLCANLVLIGSPERISIGGGVMKRHSLLPRIRHHTLEILNGYIQHEMLTPEKIADYICTPFW